MENSFEHGYPHFPPHRAWGAARIVGLIIAGVIAAVLFALLFGWLVFLLWNWLMPALFGLKAVTYWQAFGIVLLAKLLFGGVGSNHGNRHGWHHGKPRWMRGREYAGNNDWRIHGSYRDWRHFDEYWKDEGKAAFEAYIGRMQQKKEGQ
jgi:hypothetical protein